MIREAIILAGGLGTRLRTAVPELPKCMAPVAGKPFLEWLIDYCKKNGLEHFIFSLGYKHELIEEFLSGHSSQLSYKIVVEDEPLGTGGALLKASSAAGSDNVFVMNGDTFFKVDLAEMSRFHSSKDAECTIALKPIKNSDRYGIVELDENNRVTAFKEKQWYPESLVNGGVYALDLKSFLQQSYPEKFSFEKDYLEKSYPTGKIFGFTQHKYFIDIGVPDDFRKAGIELPLQND